MRLTLRTLLAYLDDVLDPVDKEELAKKIESSEFAEDLVHRTRDTVRRLRLSAPQVIGTGTALDPNTTAEYLDNVMPPEQVGDYERICLESDVHLAEATACHHVLTMILGEPADVDPIARQRMYTIATEAGERKRVRIEPAHVAPVASAIAAPIQPQPVAIPTPYVERPRGTEVPEYLRSNPWWASTTAVISLAAVVLVGTAILFGSSIRGWMAPQSKLAPLSKENGAPPLDTIASANPPESQTSIAETSPAATANTDAVGAAPLSGPPQPLTPGIHPLNAQAPSTQAAPAASDTTRSDPYATPPAAPGSTAAQPIATADTAAPPAAVPLSGTPDTKLPTIPPGAEPGNGNANAALAASTPAQGPGSADLNSGAAAPLLPSLPAPSDSAPPANALAAASTPRAESTTLPAVPAASDVATQDNKTPAPLPDAGTYLGGKTVLLHQDTKTGGWFRVEPRAAIAPGERVLSLPEFRPTIALVSGIQISLGGGTQVVMAADGAPTAPGADASGSQALEVVYGRVVLLNPTNSSKQVHLKLGPNVGTADLEHNSTLAIEVERKHVPGSDPRKAPAPVEIRLFAPEGGVVWHDAAGDKPATSPSRWTLAEGGATDVIADAAPPAWIDSEPDGQSSEQRFATPVIDGALVSNVPVSQQLLALYKGESRREVKSLVARSSIHVGLFQPFIEALRDSEQRANWKSHIETLRAAMALSPESANQVWQALTDQRNKSAGDLFEMLCGYDARQIGQTPDELKTGAISKLIGRLEDDSLDVRVLAVQDLSEITGKTLMPNPAASLNTRAQNVRRWRSRLEAGELTPVSPSKAE